MAFVYDVLEPQAYADVRFDLMTGLWGGNLKPYIDQFGVARIGPNLLMVDSMDALVQVVMGPHYDAELVDLLMGAANQVYSEGDTGKLRDNLDKVMRDWAADHNLPDRYRTFEFADQDQLRAATALALQSYEDFFGSESGIPDSDERAVLISLMQEGVDISGILTAISDLDRVGAWYELRYLSNGGIEGFPPPSQEIAARRYYQSDIFELYDEPGNVDYAQAEEVGLIYTANRENIRDYEQEYDPGNGNGPGQGDIVSELQPAILAVAEFYDIGIGKMEELLFVGRTTNYDGQSGNIEDKRHDADLVVGTLGSDTLIGGKGDDVLLGDPEDNGEGGQDDLIDGGKGNDRLYGGADGDTLLGGGGKDRLYGGGGTDHLEGGKGNDTYYLTDNSLTAVGGPEGSDPTLVGGVNDDVVKEGAKQGKDTIEVWVSSGDFNVRHIEKFRLAGDISGSVSVMLNQFDDFILSTGDDQLSLTINKLQKKPIDIVTNGGADTISIEFEPGVDPSRVLDGKGLTARFRFDDLTADDTIDLTSIGIEDVIMNRDRITDDRGFYLMAPGAKLDFMVGGKIDKTYNNSTDSWFVVKCGTDTPYGPEFIGDIDRSHFDF